MNSFRMELGGLVIFQPVLQAYPTRCSWVITAHISLGHLEPHWKLFNRQFTRSQQLLRSLYQYPSASTQLLATLQLEISNIQDIYNFGETTITSAIKITAIQLTTDTHPSQKKLTIFSWICPHLAYWNRHYKRHPQH